jgi:serine/threonine protein phosphatase 1
MEKERKFVIGDIHSHYDEMMELFEVVQFDFDNDSLISLGDLVDRGPKPIEVVEKLTTVKNLIHILGNHDEWCYQYLLNNNTPDEWILQGGKSTLDAYKKHPEYKEKHLAFFKKAKLYYIDEENRLFIHGGFDPEIPFMEQRNDKKMMIWDRSLVMKAKEYEKNNQNFSEFSEIFIGHTPTQFFKAHLPKRLSNLWMLDTGVHISGQLTIMNIETREFWQSTTKSNENQKGQ